MTEQQIELVRQLSEWLAATDIGLLELSGPGKLIRLRRDTTGTVREDIASTLDASARPASAASPSAASAVTTVRAGSVGVVLHSHPLRSEPLVRVGQQVEAGQPVALLKIGLVLVAVPAPRAGIVARIVAAHEARVGWGDALVELE